MVVAMVFSVASLAHAQTTVPSDRTLQDRIEYRFETSDLLDKYDVKIAVDAGTAVLTGTVATVAQKTAAGRLATIDGINTVKNDLVVDPEVDHTLAEKAKAGLTKTGEAITDGWITTKVRWFFVGEDLLKGRDISVDTKDHVVTLTGTVTSTAGRERAVALARRTGGVHRVVDRLTVVR
jgi:osmotically-inducible protein OsmY